MFMKVCKETINWKPICCGQWLEFKLQHHRRV